MIKKRCDNLGKWDIDIEEVNKKINNGAILIDVRSMQEYNEGHLNGAVQIADYEIGKYYKNILTNKEQEIILYCQNGVRSKKTLKKLLKLGFKNVYNLAGGLDNLL